MLQTKGRGHCSLLLSFSTANIEFSCKPHSFRKARWRQSSWLRKRLTGWGRQFWRKNSQWNCSSRLPVASKARGPPNLSHLNLASLCTYRMCPIFFQQHPVSQHSTSQNETSSSPQRSYVPCFVTASCILASCNLAYLENMPVISPWEAGEP